MTRFFILAIFFLVQIPMAFGQTDVRTWTDKTGQFKLPAKLIAVDSKDNARLLDKEGTLRSVPIKALSERDITEIERFRANREKGMALAESASNSVKAGAAGGARQGFESASKLDPWSTRSAFAAGLLNYALEHDVEKSDQFFQLARRRFEGKRGILSNLETRNYVATLNNLAIVCIRRNKPTAAFTYWERALTCQDFAPQEIIQNLGTVRNLLTTTNIREATFWNIYLKPEESRKLDSLVGSIRLGPKSSPWRPGTGFHFMGFLSSLPEVEEDNDKADIQTVASSTPSGKPADVLPAWSGSGFVIAPDLVMTNHHVATDDGVPAVYLEVETGPDYSAPMGAKVLAYSSRYDVAILKTSRPLQVVPLKFAQSAPGIGTDINAFGFPTGAAFGKGLTTSKGNIMRLPTMDTGNISSIFGDAAVASSLWHSCQVNGGSSGGPLLSNSGIVVGVEWGAYNPDGATGGQTGMGVSLPQLQGFLAQVFPDYLKVPTYEDGPGINDDVRNAITFIQAYQPALFSSLPSTYDDAREKKPDNVWEDWTCFACNGTTQVRCRVASCAKGWISKVTVENKFMGARKTIKLDCPNCVEGIIKCHILYKDDERYYCTGEDYRFVLGIK